MITCRFVCARPRRPSETAAMPAAMPTCRRNFRLVDLLDMCRGSMEGARRQRPPHLQFARQLLAPCTGARADRHRQRAMMSHRRCRCKAGQAIPLTISYFEVTSQVGLLQSAQTLPCPHRGQCARTGYNDGRRRRPGHRRKLRHRDRSERWNFRKAWIEARIVYTDGGGETQQAMVSNSAQIGVTSGLLGAFSLYSKGAPFAE